VAVAPSKLVIVDTNCYVRLYLSPVRPILGASFGAYKLVTLTELKVESGPGSRIADLYPFLGAQDIQRELDDACLRIREPKKSRIAKLVAITMKQANIHLARHCKDTNLLVIREISGADARALVAADVLDAALATDEWPLTLAAKMLGYPGEVFDTLDVLHLMEKAGGITVEQRRETVRTWGGYGEEVPRGWDRKYATLFGEPFPTGQAPRSHSA
jgi:hypothetical protein